MKNLLVILVLIAIVSVEAERKAKKDPDFIKWKNQYKKDKWEDKDSESLEKRAARVLEKKRRCNKHNEEPDTTWVCGSNEYDHLTSEEAESRLKGLVPPLEARALPKFNEFTATNAPLSGDWSSYCQPIVNQGRCGCCWAFAALGVLECYNKIKGFNSPLLAPQFLVDCDLTSTNNRCNGGWPTTAYNVLKNQFNTSCPSWADYAYTSASYTTANTGYATCKSSLKRFPLNYTNTYQTSVNGNEALMRSIIANFGPVAVGLYSSSSFLSYRSGVFYDSTCPKATATIPQCDFRNLNHAVIITGFGLYNNVPVWKVKNSWGTTWGEQGYIYMRRDALNNCNTACIAMYVD